MTIKRMPQMNRVYLLGDCAEYRDLLCDIRARRDTQGRWWLPIRDERFLRKVVKAEKAYQAARQAEQATWDKAKSVIPADYKSRHGAALGGVAAIGGETFDEPALDTSRLEWTVVAVLERRVRDLTGNSLINGRVSDRETLYNATAADGRPLYRISSSHGFGDDLRETYYLPEDLWRQLLTAEVRMRGITPEAAREWLGQYRGCVGTELYEFAAASALGEHHARRIG